MSVAIKNADEIAKMRVAGRLASELLDFLTPHVRAGITTGELDRIAHDYQVNVQNVVLQVESSLRGAFRRVSNCLGQCN